MKSTEEIVTVGVTSSQLTVLYKWLLIIRIFLNAIQEINVNMRFRIVFFFFLFASPLRRFDFAITEPR